jgi:lysophospholipase L1-like esterase
MSHLLSLLVAAAIVGLGLVAAPPPVAAQEQSPGERMVALGDSYTSGEGVPPFVARTDVSGLNQCHRSPLAYPQLVATSLGLPLTSWACSGATTGDLTSAVVSMNGPPWNDPVFEVTSGAASSALDRLGPNVSLVTLTLGGNDVGFQDVVVDCLLSSEPCTEHDAAVQLELGRLAGVLDALFADIAGRISPQGRVLVVGYPRAFPAIPHADCDFIPLLPIGTFTVAEQLWANATTAEVNSVVRQAAERAAAAGGSLFSHVDVWESFAGSELCRPDPESSRPLVSSPLLNGVDMVNFEHSFHPSATGHRVLADRVLAHLGGGTIGGETVGLVDPTTGLWSLRNTGGQVTSFFFGNPGDFPVIGDWDCDGDETPGMYRRSDGFVYLRNSNTQGVADIRFFFGNPGDIPIVGDFNGNGCDTVSIYRPSLSKVFIINVLGENNGGLGAAELEYFFGNPGDKPFVGDFDGDGIETIGLHRESTGLVYFRNSHTQGVADNQFIFGDPGDRLVAGDWIASGVDSPAVFRPSNTTFYFRHSNTQGVADNQFVWGEGPFLPVAGNFGLG